MNAHHPLVASALLLLVGGCVARRHGDRSVLDSGTPGDVGAQFLEAAQTGRPAAFDFEGQCWANVPLQLAQIQSSAGPDKVVASLLAPEARSELEKKKLAQYRSWLAEANCTVGSPFRTTNSKRLGTAGISSYEKWLGRISSLVFISLNCTKPDLVLFSEGGMGLEDKLIGVVVVTYAEPAQRLVLDLLFEDRGVPYGVVADYLVVSPTE